TGFVGTLIGITLCKDNLSNKAMLYCSLAGFLSIVTGVLMIIFGAPFTTLEDFTALSNYFLKLGGQVLLVCLTLYFIEFKGRAMRFGNNFLVKFFRRWGIISLTIYILQIFEYFPRLILQLLFGSVANVNFIQNAIYGRGQEWGVIFVTYFTMLWFYFLILTWGKIQYIGSFEWGILKLQEKLFHTKSRRIQPEILLNDVQWINFSQEIQPSAKTKTTVHVP
ncbi:MAG: hypothetical protein U9O98_11715, partial [Asgard group archaeon]|nr:hypothetical protein [Asgard group archaeon]